MDFLLETIVLLTWKHLVMYAIGITLIFLAIQKEYEPALLLPMGFGAILVNLPLSGVLNQMLLGIGAMIDFSPLLSRPVFFLFGAAAHFGIFATITLSVLLGFSLQDAAA